MRSRPVLQGTLTLCGDRRYRGGVALVPIMSSINRRTALVGIAALASPVTVPAVPAFPATTPALEALLGDGWQRISLGSRWVDRDHVPGESAIDLASQKVGCAT